MRRSTSVRLVLLPMLATAAIASTAAAQPGPDQSQGQGGEPQQAAPAEPAAPAPADPYTDPDILPPGMTPMVSGIPLCNDPESWPQQYQDAGEPPPQCSDDSELIRCDDSTIVAVPAECAETGTYAFWGTRGYVVRGGFGHYFGGHGGGYGG